MTALQCVFFNIRSDTGFVLTDSSLISKQLQKVLEEGKGNNLMVIVLLTNYDNSSGMRLLVLS